MSNELNTYWEELTERRCSLTVRQIFEYLEALQVFHSQREISKRTGMSEQDVSTYLRLGNANERIIKALEDKELSLSAVEPLLALDPEDQKELAPAAVHKKTVRGVKALIAAHRLSKSPVTERKETPDDLVDPNFILVTTLLNEALNILHQVENILPIIKLTSKNYWEIDTICGKVEERAIQIARTIE